MNVALRPPAMTRDEFLDWAARQERRHEFDGAGPVAMTGGTLHHNLITINIPLVLRTCLRGTSCMVFGPDAGVATVSKRVRYPDALVTAAAQAGTGRLVADPLVVFEVVSPGSEYTDRILKVRGYAAVPTIRRYVIAEQTSMGLTVFCRAGAGQGWTANVLTAEDMLDIPEVDVRIPVRELHQGTSLPETEPDDGR